MHLDFNYPVIDFASDVNDKIWVSLDTRRTATGMPIHASPPIRVVEFVEGGKVVVDDSPNHPSN
jgi:hypothetical protein